MTTDTSRCTSCRHMVTREAAHANRVDLWCNAPQIRAAHGGASRCIFEADGFDKEWNRDKPETRKCGTTFQNWEPIT